jgi:type II secretion system protein G
MNKKMRNLRLSKGFTLIELLIVIIILGVIAALITGNFITSLKKGRDARRKADLEETQRALEMYYEDKKAYPGILTFGSALCETPACVATEKVYMQKVPNDPIPGKAYEYDLTGSSYRLYACLENNQQVLPYDSLTQVPSMTCSVLCKNKSGVNTSCIWAISSSDISP